MNCRSEVSRTSMHIRHSGILLTYHAAGTIWCVELIRREIKRQHPETEINAILIDFFLYDTMKQLEAQGKETMPHHRTRSIWY